MIKPRSRLCSNPGQNVQKKHQGEKAYFSINNVENNYSLRFSPVNTLTAIGHNE